MFRHIDTWEKTEANFPNSMSDMTELYGQTHRYMGKRLELDLLPMSDMTELFVQTHRYMGKDRS
jgi:hypothetical protein